MTSPLTPPSQQSLTLYEQAQAVAARAYVPYSSFRVGAVLEFADGSTVAGCNVENASYGLTVCAERAAVVRAIAEGRMLREVTRVVVAVDGPSGEPCGMCRQVLAEHVPNARIAFMHAGELQECDVRDLLPAHFDAAALAP
jgi:cytidine deaminase